MTADIPPDEASMTPDEIYRVLASANLARVRGEYKEATAQCLAILRQNPEDGDAHTLLGDIHAEMGDLDQAVQWYELALDLDPNSEADRTKLQSVQHRIQTRQTAETAQTIGLPEARSNLRVAIAAVVVMVAIVGFSAFVFGQNRAKAVAERPTISVPIEAPAPREETKTEPPVEAPAEPTPEPFVAVETPVPTDDEKLASDLRTKLPGRPIVAVSENVRDQSLTIVLRPAPGADLRILAAETARDVMTELLDVNSLTVKVLEATSVTYLADVTRERLAAAETSSASLANWAALVVANEWRPTDASASPG